MIGDWLAALSRFVASLRHGWAWADSAGPFVDRSDGFVRPPEPEREEDDEARLQAMLMFMTFMS